MGRPRRPDGGVLGRRCHRDAARQETAAAAATSSAAGPVPRRRDRQQPGRRGAGEGAPRHDRMLLRHVDAFVGKDYVSAHDIALPDLPGDVRAGAAAGRRVRRHRRGPAAAGWGQDRPGRYGRRRAAGADDAGPSSPHRCGARRLACGAAHRAPLPADRPRPDGGTAARPRPPADTFRSVRTYPAVARRSGCGSRPSRVDSPLQRLGRPPTARSRCPRVRAGRLVRAGAAAGPARARGDHRPRRLGQGPAVFLRLSGCARARPSTSTGPTARRPRSGSPAERWRRAASRPRRSTRPPWSRRCGW